MYTIITNGERRDVSYFFGDPYRYERNLNFGSQIYEGTQLIGTVKKEDLISISFDIFEISITRNIHLLYDKIKPLAIYTKRQKISFKRQECLILLKSLNSYKRNLKKIKMLIPHIRGWVLEGKLLTNKQYAELDEFNNSQNKSGVCSLLLQWSIHNKEEIGIREVVSTIDRCKKNNNLVISFIEEYLKVESPDNLIDSFSRYEFILFNLTDYFLHVSKISDIPDNSVFSFYIKMHDLLIIDTGIDNLTYHGDRYPPGNLYINFLGSKKNNLTDYFKQSPSPYPFGGNINSEVTGPPYLMDRLYFIAFFFLFPFLIYFAISWTILGLLDLNVSMQSILTLVGIQFLIRYFLLRIL